MHLQQTKQQKIKTGGPQYYFHDLSDAVRTYLRVKKAVPVALVTPYGATKTIFSAVSKDAKLSPSGKTVSGKVDHDRIQSFSKKGSFKESIGESIRYWYNLPKGKLLED